MQRIAGVVLRVTAALLALAVLVIRTLVEVGVLASQGTLESALIIGGGLLVFIDSSRSAYKGYRRPDTQKRIEALRKTVRGVQLALAEETGYAVPDLGGSVFLVKRHPVLFWNRFLKRISRNRFSEYPAESFVLWTKGKGVIGQVWETAAPRHEYLAPLAAGWTKSRRHTEADYAALPESDRQGLGWSEFVILAPKYAEVIAVPIVAPTGKLLGVFSMDVVYSERRVPAGPRLDTENVRVMMTTTAGVLRDYLS